MNTGTVVGLSRLSASGGAFGLGTLSADRSAMGRSRRSTPSPGEPVTWGRAAVVSRRIGGCNAERCVPEWGCLAELAWWAAAGIGDAGQASPLGGGRSWFDDLFNLVHDPATLIAAWQRVAGNQGAKTAGSDGWTVTRIENEIGVPGFLDYLRALLKAGSSGPNRCGNARSPNRAGRARFVASEFRR